MTRRVLGLRGLTPALLALFLLSTPGCQVDPFCLDCVDGRLDAGRADSGDAGGTRDTGTGTDGGDTGASDADLDAYSLPDGCTPGAPELCNMFDDDCDLAVDEGIDTTTDLDNCGRCGNRCSFAHAFGDCTASACVMGACDVNYYDRDGDPSNGCENRCITTDVADSVCDNRDNDCDGMVDEDFDLQNDPMNCGICGRGCRFAHSMSGCSMGVCGITGCDTGFMDIDGVALNGCEYGCTPVGAEICNLRDDDCDGMVDDGDPESGGACGVNVGICTAGVEHCEGGTLVCRGAVVPGVELCNGLDDDCDGTVDDGNPEGGGTCGSGTGTCVPGREICTAGALVCMGGTGPVAEACNGLDDDCDGMADNGDPGGGGTCGTDTGSCTAGTVRCSGGNLTCMGAVGPTLDLCNGLDDDCDGTPDQTYSLATDPRNCGMCGRVCTFPNAIAGCSMGGCGLVACLTNFFNNDMDPANGCEYACTRVSSTESCNGADDDCDGRIDEMLTPPANFCNPNGVCAGTVATCPAAVMGMPAPTWTCSYPMATYQATETRCDALDNDCDGSVDEPFVGVGTACNNGELGTCRRTGTRVCNATMDGLRCNAPAVGMGTTEICNGLNDDCDMVTDEGTVARGSWTRVTPASGADFWIQSYEASRPDSRPAMPAVVGPPPVPAMPATQGISSAMVCSEPGRLPWVSVTPAEAATACTLVGGTLCSEAQWQRACQSSTGACTWSYPATCSTYSSMQCNGNDFDSDASMSGDQDALLTTGALASCRVPWTVAGTTTSIYDLSGNAQEWTAPRSAGVNPMRGGSYNDAAGGTTCGFSFEVGGPAIRLPNVGFRCCRATAP